VPLSELPPPPTESTGEELPLIKTAPPGPRSRALAEKLGRLENPAFQKRRDARKESAGGADMGPIVLARGLGSNVWDADDNRYVDLAAGFGAVSLGHRANAIERAITSQSDRLTQGLGDLYASEPKIALLERLAKLHPTQPARVMLATSGAEAVTAAIKTACLATGKPGLIAFEGAYHGLSYAPLSACGYKESYRAPFAEQLNPHVSFAPYPHDAASLEVSLAAVDATLAKGRVGAILVEPILGRGGLVVPPAGFLAALVERAHARGALVIADEVWTGIGRSGAVVLSAREVAVDIVVLGKALGGGFPIAACSMSEAVGGAWARPAGPVGPAGDDEVVHTSTHAGWPLACAAAIAVLDTVRFRKLDERAEAVGARFMASLAAQLEGAPGFVGVRGRGLVVGVELASGALGLRALRGWLQKGFVATTAGGSHQVLVATPPLTIEEPLLDAAAVALREVLDVCAAS
jgi:4-aminobutyrate aminotransferase/(S)-3-amino-2-methylpropionate transaminase